MLLRTVQLKDWSMNSREAESDNEMLFKTSLFLEVTLLLFIENCSYSEGAALFIDRSAAFLFTFSKQTNLWTEVCVGGIISV